MLDDGFEWSDKDPTKGGLIMKQLDWTRLLGFEQIVDRRQSLALPEAGGRMAGKVGQKEGLKKGA